MRNHILSEKLKLNVSTAKQIEDKDWSFTKHRWTSGEKQQQQVSVDTWLRMNPHLTAIELPNFMLWLMRLQLEEHAVAQTHSGHHLEVILSHHACTAMAQNGGSTHSSSQGMLGQACHAPMDAQGHHFDLQSYLNRFRQKSDEQSTGPTTPQTPSIGLHLPIRKLVVGPRAQSRDRLQIRDQRASLDQSSTTTRRSTRKDLAMPYGPSPMDARASRS